MSVEPYVACGTTCEALTTSGTVWVFSFCPSPLYRKEIEEPCIVTKLAFFSFMIVHVCLLATMSHFIHVS